jgi:sn-glycerol 3-phosphate transport system substrate-binding protein
MRAGVAVVVTCVFAFTLGSAVTATPDRVQCTTAGVDDSSGTITVWHVTGFAGAQLLDDVTSEFERRYPAIDVQLVNVTDFGGPIDALRSDLPSPDVVLAGQDAQINLPDSGRVTPASACIAADRSFDFADLLPAVATANSVDDVVWSMPFLVSTPVVYFDRERFRTAGLDPDDAPDDLDELRAQLEALRGPGGAADGLVSGSPHWYASVWAADLGIELGESNGRTEFGPAEIDIDHPDLVERLNLLGSLAADDLITDIDEPDYADLLRLVSPTAPAGMVAHTSGSMSNVYDFIDDGNYPGTELGIFPFPATTNGTIIGGTNAWLTAPFDNQPAAWAFIEALASTDTQARAGTIGYVPARLSAIADPNLEAAWRLRPGLRVPVDAVLRIIPESRHLGWTAGPEPTVRWRLAMAVEEIIAGKPPKEALAAAELDINRVLQTYQTLRGQTTP